MFAFGHDISGIPDEHIEEAGLAMCDLAARSGLSRGEAADALARLARMARETVFTDVEL